MNVTTVSKTYYEGKTKKNVTKRAQTGVFIEIFEKENF